MAEEASHEMQQAYGMADGYKRLVHLRTGISANELRCPHQQSDMTPCIAVSGNLAVCEPGLCVGCEQSVAALLAREKEKHNG